MTSKGGGGPSIVLPPDYAGAAVAQGEANLEAAQASAKLNNPNIITPLGTQTVEYGVGAFNQQGFDAAMAAYDTQLAAFQNNPATYTTTPGTPGTAAVAGTPGQNMGRGIFLPGTPGTPAVAAVPETRVLTGGVAQPKLPTRGQFQTPGDPNIGTVTQTFSPEQQALYEQETANQLALGQLGAQGTESLQGVVGVPVDFSGAPAAATTPQNIPQNIPNVPGNIPNITGQVPTNIPQNIPGVPQNIPQNIPGNVPNVPGRGPEQYRSDVINAMMSRVDVDTERQRDDTRSTLIARGIRPGTKAWERESDFIGRDYNDARQQAIIAGGAEASRDFAIDSAKFGMGQQQFNMGAQQFGMGQEQFGMGMQQFGAGVQQFGLGQEQFNMGAQQFGMNQDLFNQGAQQFGMGQDQFNMGMQQFGAGQQQFNMGEQQFAMDTQARNQAITEYLAQRQTPLNEINALMSGSQVTSPFAGGLGYQAGSNVAPAPIFGAAQAQGQDYQSSLDREAGQSNSMTSGLFGLGAGALMAGATYFSDRRLKSNIKLIGTHPLGIGIYEYDIFGEHDVGVMADEVLRVKPSAVHMMPNGYMAVNYGGL